jgi:putative ABC transport system permease protein
MKILIRNIRRQKAFAFINIFGLAIGFAACLIAYLYISDELSYDKYHHKSHRIYRMLNHYPDRNLYSGIQPGVFYDFANDNLPGVEALVRFFNWEGALSYGDNKFHETNLRFSDSVVFDIFSWQFIRGDKSTALKNAYDLVITQSAAKKYFGDEDPLGKTIRLDNAFDLLVTGVIEDIPENSHFRFSFLGNSQIFKTINPSSLDSWDNSGTYFYVLLHQQADPEEVGARLHDLFMESKPEGRPAPPAFALQPLEEIHLFSANVRWDISSHGSIQNVYGFAVVAFLILLIACFNFTNLTTAGAHARAREVGLKKVLGANRKRLVAQFLGESLFFATIALLLALVIVELVMPYFNHLTGKELNFGFAAVPQLYTILPVMLIIVTLLAGLYPAFVLSGFHPLSILKGGSLPEIFKGLGKQKFQYRIRQFLIVLQFSISAGLIIAAILINEQMQFVRKKDLGFNQEALLIIENPWDTLMRVRFDRLNTDLKKIPAVTGVSGSHNIPGRNLNNYTGSFRQRNAPGEEGVHTGLVSVDPDFFKVMDAQIIAGRDFSKEFANEADGSCIINQALANQLKIDDPVGVEAEGFYDGKSRKIIGVVKDMHFTSLHEKVTPTAFYISEKGYPPYTTNIIVKINPADVFRTMHQIEQQWLEVAPAWPFQSYFLDNKLNELYRQEKQVTRTTNIFSGLAIFLSLMGLFGLILFVMRARTREIGIRQIHGATTANLLRMFTGEFVKLILIANLVAWPLVWLFIQNWLERFVFRISIDALPFILAAMITLLLTMVMVAYHVIRTLRANPVESLKYE